MSDSKKSMIFIVIGALLQLQYWVLKSFGVVRRTTEWVWSSDIPSMLGVIGTILLFIGLYYHFKAKRRG